MAGHSPLISPEAAFARLTQADLRLVDVRWVMGAPGGGRAAYDTGHLPGAIFLDLDTDLAAAHGPGRHPLPSPATFRERLEAVGISADDEVVAYDNAGGTTAARLWWMLDDLGHDRASVLDGGLSAWVDAGYPVTTESPPTRPSGTLRLHDTWTKVTDRAGVLTGLGSIVLLDARAEPRYRGEVEPIDRVPGHIPTARNVPTSDSLGVDGRLLTPEELASRLRQVDAGVDDVDTHVVTSCGSGVTACFTSLTMRLAGLPDPILYPGSYSDWTQAGMPIATGPDPGEFRAQDP
jgi:thiosulfate/3-mercaptopyruvate sulfurtransferase